MEGAGAANQVTNTLGGDKVFTHSTRLVVGLIAAVSLLCGCVAPPLVPTEKQVETVRSIDLIIHSPPSNFAYFQGNSAVYAQPSAGMSVGAGIGINVIGNLLVAGLSQAATATARSAEGPVGASVADLNIRASILEELRAALASSKDPIRLIESNRPFPKVSPLAPEDFLKEVSKPAEGSLSDAQLYLSVLPFFRSQSGRMLVFGGSWLVARSGTPIFSTFVTFVGPEHPELDRPELIKWWADQRYRRYIQHGVRSTLMLTLEYLVRPPSDARRQVLQSLAASLPPLTPNADWMRSTVCPFEADDAPVVYSFERGSHSLRAVAHCVTEVLAFPFPRTNPDQSWTTPQQPGLNAGASR